MELIYFLGRFHVLALHIPIGIVVAVFVLELLARKAKYRRLESAAPFLWTTAAVSAILTSVLGYMHFAEGGFEGASGAQHRAFGTALAVVITLIAALRSSRFAPSYMPAYLPAAAGSMGGATGGSGARLQMPAPDSAREITATRTKGAR